MGEIILNWPPRQLTPNFKRSHHWAAYRGYASSYREDCGWLTKEARISVAAGDVPVNMTVTLHPPDARHRDQDGMIGSLKHALDGISDALGIDDRHFRVRYVFGDSVKNGRVKVQIL